MFNWNKIEEIDKRDKYDIQKEYNNKSKHLQSIRGCDIQTHKDNKYSSIQSI